MAKIQIRRGLQAAVTNLVLAEGELAVALDTGNVYVGTTSGKVHINPPGGTADEAVKLKTARAFSITGDGAASSVNFDGTAAVNLILSLATVMTAGMYAKVSVDAKGRVIGGAGLEVSDIPSGIPLTKITGQGTAATYNIGTASGQLVPLGSDGKFPESVMPALAIMDIFEAANQQAMLAAAAQKGDICIRSDENKSYILSGDDPTTLANWKWLRTPTDVVLSVCGKTGAVSLTSADVGAQEPVKNALAKASIADNDTVIINDSAASEATKKITWANLKAAIKAYCDTLYNKYVHPTYTAQASGLYKVTVDAMGHVSAVAAAAKADITALGIPAQDTVYSLPTASTSVKGGMQIDGASIVMTGGVASVGDIDGGSF